MCRRRPPEPRADSRRGRSPCWWVGLAAASLVATALLLAFGDDLGRPRTASPSSWSEGALGHRALVELLPAVGLGVVTRQSRAAMGLGPDRPLVLAEPDPDAAGRRQVVRRRPHPASGPSQEEDEVPPPADAFERDALAHGAAIVLVLPKWRAVPDPDHPGWVAAATPWPAAQVPLRVEQALGSPPVPDLAVLRQGALRRRAAHGGSRPSAGADAADRAEIDAVSGDGQGAGGGLDCRFVSGDSGAAGWAPALELAPAQLIVPNDALQPVVACRDGWLVARRPGEAAAPEMLLIADPDLLNNQGLGRGDHAALVVRLLAGELHARGVILDETIHGFRRENGLLAEALSFPLLPATLQGLLLAGLLVWAANSRLGKPLPAAGPSPPGKAVLIENTAALLALGGHAGDSLARYYRITLRAVADHYFLPQDLPPAELRSRLASITAATVTPATAAPPATAASRPSGRPALESPLLLEHLVQSFDRPGARAGRRGETGRANTARAVAAAQRIHRWRLGMTDAPRPGR
jgi:hypothetical protein